MAAEPPASVSQMPIYYQLKAELDVSFRRYVKEMKDEIVARIDRSEDERREERKELEARVRRLEQSIPEDLAEQLRTLHDQSSSARTTGKLVVLVGSFVLSVLSVVAALVSAFP